MIEEVTMTSHFATVDGRKVHYQTAGSGDVLMLIHGGGPGAFGYSNYRFNVGPLSKNHQVVVIDLPGFGQSEVAPMPESMFAPMAVAAIGVLDDMGVAKASVVGNSLGGGTALRMALDHPDRIHKMVLMGPGGGLPMTSPFPTEGLKRMMTFYDGTPPTLERLRHVVDLLVYDPSKISAELLTERLKAASRPDVMNAPPLKGRGAHPKDELWREPLARLEHPTLVLWGKEDRILSLDMAFAFLKTLPNSELHVFSKCGHWVQWEKAEEFNQIVDSFICR